jgi:hypothetical protein
LGQFSGQVEAQTGEEIVEFGLAQVGVLSPAGSCLAGLRACGAVGGLGQEQLGAGVPYRDEGVVGVRRAVGDDREVGVDAVGGEGAPGFGDLLQDRRAARGAGFGEVLLVDGCGTADGVFDLGVGVGRVAAQQDDVVEVACVVGFDADGDGGVGGVDGVLA